MVDFDKIIEKEQIVLCSTPEEAIEIVKLFNLHRNKPQINITFSNRRFPLEIRFYLYKYNYKWTYQDGYEGTYFISHHEGKSIINYSDLTIKSYELW